MAMDDRKGDTHTHTHSPAQVDNARLAAGPPETNLLLKFNDRLWIQFGRLALE